MLKNFEVHEDFRPCPVCYADKLITLEQYNTSLQIQNAMKNVSAIERELAFPCDDYDDTALKIMQDMAAERLERNHALLKRLTGNERGFLPEIK
jgi:hypothetical protein